MDNSQKEPSTESINKQATESSSKPVAEKNQEEVKDAHSETTESNLENQADSKENDGESDKEINFKKFREAREKDRQAKLEAERLALKREQEAKVLKEALEAALNKKPVQEPEYDDYNADVKKEVQKQIEAYHQAAEKKRHEEEAKNLPNKIVEVYPDFHQVLSQENIDYLEYHYPEVSKSLSYMPESMEKYSTIYSFAKKHLPGEAMKKNIKKAEANLRKPQSLSSGAAQTGDTQIRPSLDRKTKQANWERMQKVMRGG